MANTALNVAYRLLALTFIGLAAEAEESPAEVLRQAIALCSMLCTGRFVRAALLPLSGEERAPRAKVRRIAGRPGAHRACTARRRITRTEAAFDWRGR
jgi:hypothetical protein